MNNQEASTNSDISQKPVETIIPQNDVSRQTQQLDESSLQRKSLDLRLKERQEKFRQKQKEIKDKYKEMGINLDKIKFKNQIYVEWDNKGKEVKVIDERAIKFLQGKQLLQKEKSLKNEKEKQYYKEELEQTIKLKTQFEEKANNEKQETGILLNKRNEQYQNLVKEYKELDDKYRALSSEKQKQLQNDNSGSSIIPLVMTRIDDIVKENKKFLKLSEQDLMEFRAIKRDTVGIINKMVFLIQKLKEKEEEKQELEKEQKVQTEFHNDEKKRLRQIVADFSKKFKKSEQLVQILKVQNKRCLRIMTEKQSKLDQLIKNRNSLKKKYEEYEKIEKVQGKLAAKKQALRRKKVNTRQEMKNKLHLPSQMEDKLNRICAQQFKIDQQNGVPMRKPTQNQRIFIEGLIQMGALNNYDDKQEEPPVQPTQEQKIKQFEEQKLRRKKQGITLIRDPISGKVSMIPNKKLFSKKQKVHKIPSSYGQYDDNQQDQIPRASTSNEK